MTLPRASARTLLILRPLDQASEFASEVERHYPGRWNMMLSPLMEMVPFAPPPDLGEVRAFLFTSGNAVKVFASQCGRRDIPCLCVGDRTAAIAQMLGFQTTSAHGNVENLKALALSMFAGSAGVLMHLRGEHAAGSLSADLNDLGLPTHEAIIYDQRAIPLSMAAEQALTAGNVSVAMLFSTRSAQIFSAELARIGAAPPQTLVCISEAVASCIDAPLVLIAKRPDAASMFAALDAA